MITPNESKVLFLLRQAKKGGTLDAMLNNALNARLSDAKITLLLSELLRLL